MPSISDQDFNPAFVEQAQAGDESAQQAIYLHFAPQVYKLARHILQCEASAEEVVQECFVDVLCKIEHFRHQGSFAGWLRRIAVNHCLMLLRSSWIKKRHHVEEFDGLEGDDQGPIDHMAVRGLNHIFSKLPAQTRAVLWLHDVEGYTHGEIAKFMGKSISFSKSQLVRAHEKIRDQWQNQSLSENQATGDEVSSCMPLLNNY